MPSKKKSLFEGLRRDIVLSITFVTTISVAVILVISSLNLIKKEVELLRMSEGQVEKVIESELGHYISELQVLSKQPNTLSILENQDFLESGTSYESSVLFTEYLENDPNYSQLRIISNDGVELFRVNRTDSGVKVFSREELQDKSDRSYHQEISKLPVGFDYYISKIELNQEYGVIEEPIEPVIRVAVPLLVDSEQKGYLIANLDASTLIFQSLEDSGGFLITQEGEYLRANDESIEFGGPDNLRTGYNYFDIEPELGKKLNDQPTGVYLNTTKIVIYRTFFEPFDTPNGPIRVNEISYISLLGAVFFPFLSLLLGGVFSVVLIRFSLSRAVKSLAEPLKSINELVTAVSLGDYDVEVREQPYEELQNISNSVNVMAGKIKDLTNKNEQKIADQNVELSKQVDQLRKQKNELLLYNEVLEKSTNAIFITDTKGIINYGNPALSKITGYALPEIIGTKAGSLWGNKMPREFYKKMWHKISHNKGVFRGTLEGLRKDGSKVKYELMISPILTDAGAITSYLAIMNDITQAFEAKAAQEFKILQYENAFKNSPIGVALVGLDGSWLEVNDTLVKLLGYSREEFLTKTFQDITHPDDLEKDLDLVKQTIEGKIQGYSMEKRYFTKARDIVWVLLTVSIVRNPKGEPEFFISQVQDINERKAFEERIVETNKTKSKIIGILSHQLRTPLSSILWNIESLLNGDLGKLRPEQRSILENVHIAETYINKRINDLLLVTEIEDSNVVLKKEVYDIVGVFNAEKAKFSKTLKDKRINLKVTKTNVKEFEFDVNRIAKVFNVFIENALDYSEDGSEVSVELKHEGGLFSCKVVDEGIGITENEKNKIFTKFFRGPNALVMETDRSGLGLYIAKVYIEMHGGKIGFVSEGGKGATFWFEIPAITTKNNVTTIAPDNFDE